MIRHSSSLFLSFIFHIAFFIGLYFVYKIIFDIPKPKVEKKICIDLCALEEKKIVKPLQKTAPKRVKKQEKIIKPKIPKKKLQPKKSVKKEQVKHQEVIKKVPIIQEKLTPIVEMKEEKERIEINTPISRVDAPKKIQQDTTKNFEQEYIDENIKKIRALISDNLYYPRRARKRGVIGEVMVKFHLSKEAVVSNISVISSEHDILSRAAIETIERLSSEFPKPKQQLILNVPIVYTLH